MARYGKDLNENDIGKFFMIFDNTPYISNKMFIVEGMDQVDENTKIPIIKYALFDNTFSHLQRMTDTEFKREIIEIPIPPNLIQIMRKYVSSSLTVAERQSVQKRGALGGRKKTRRYKHKSSKSRKSRKSRRGGMCYGTGVGTNSSDPNFSIYNTRELSLFPYRPTN